MQITMVSQLAGLPIGRGGVAAGAGDLHVVALTAAVEYDVTRYDGPAIEREVTIGTRSSSNPPVMPRDDAIGIEPDAESDPRLAHGPCPAPEPL
ncbi:hypothetical protein [Nocardia araoensis]|uniref:hypothetical protein n=1 Tax=Nocardia araoensis TaxID=228600 RepID=UPI0002F76EDD|nr:hypothetical protein [Nocardia araoensis]